MSLPSSLVYEYNCAPVLHDARSVGLTNHNLAPHESERALHTERWINQSVAPHESERALRTER